MSSLFGILVSRWSLIQFSISSLLTSFGLFTCMSLIPALDQLLLTAHYLEDRKAIESGGLWLFSAGSFHRLCCASVGYPQRRSHRRFEGPHFCPIQQQHPHQRCKHSRAHLKGLGVSENICRSALSHHPPPCSPVMEPSQPGPCLSTCFGSKSGSKSKVEQLWQVVFYVVWCSRWHTGRHYISKH